MGLAGQWVRVSEAPAQVEVYYGPHRVRCVGVAPLSTERRS
jgi:hypothetical protein